MRRIIEKVKSQIPKDINGFSFIKTQELFIPYMEIGVECLIRDISEINLFFETILNLVEIDVKDIQEISDILGVTFDITKEAVVDMYEGGYLNVSEHTLRITKKGEEALQTKKLVEIKKKNISKIMIDLITGDIYDGTNMKVWRVRKSDVCLDSEIDVSKAFLDSNYNVINQVFQKQQEAESFFGKSAVTKELYKIVRIYYQDLVYMKNEVLLYKGDDSEEIQFKIQSDSNDKYLNCLYSQLRERTHPCLEYFFERDRDFIKKQVSSEAKLDVSLSISTKNAINELRYKKEIENIDTELFRATRYSLTDKEYINYFIYSDEIKYDRLVIYTNRVKSILIPEILRELVRISEKKNVFIIYDQNEFNASKTINYFLGKEKNNRNLFILPSDNIDKTLILFESALKIDVQEYLSKAFNKHITYKIAIIDFSLRDEDVILEEISTKYDIEALAQSHKRNKINKKK